MNKKVMLHSAMVLLMAAFVAAPAAAQNTASLGPQIGFYKAQDADNAQGMGGIALRLKLNKVLGVEGSINYRKEVYGNGFATVRSWPVMLTGLIYPIPILYGAMGAGWYNTSIEYNLIPSVRVRSQEFGWHFGGGVELPVGSAGKLVGDIKYVFLNYNFNNFPGSNDVQSNFYVMTVGFLFNI